MKKQILWFVVGFIFAYAIFHGPLDDNNMPADRMALLPESRKIMLDEMGLSFLKAAYHSNAGNIDIYTPSDESAAMAYMTIKASDGIGQIMMFDNTGDGNLDQLIYFDKALHSIAVEDKDDDGIWDQWIFSEKPKENMYIDSDLDGQPDFSHNLSKNKDVFVFIKNSWRKVIDKGEKEYVEIDGKLEEIDVKKDKYGVWRISPNKAL